MTNIKKKVAALASAAILTTGMAISSSAYLSSGQYAEFTLSSSNTKYSGRNIANGSWEAPYVSPVTLNVEKRNSASGTIHFELLTQNTVIDTILYQNDINGSVPDTGVIVGTTSNRIFAYGEHKSGTYQARVTVSWDND